MSCSIDGIASDVGREPMMRCIGVIIGVTQIEWLPSGSPAGLGYQIFMLQSGILFNYLPYPSYSTLGAGT